MEKNKKYDNRYKTVVSSSDESQSEESLYSVLIEKDDSTLHVMNPNISMEFNELSLSFYGKSKMKNKLHQIN